MAAVGDELGVEDGTAGMVDGFMVGFQVGGAIGTLALNTVVVAKLRNAVIPHVFLPYSSRM